MSSPPTHKAANLARIRENQRRSRARRREYVQELESRVRLCEIQGVEASAEVQMAARRVAEENRQLRGLLNQQGVDDRFIAHYLQNSSSGAEGGQGTIPPMAGETPVQSLQQLMAPRRPASLEPAPPYPLPNQASREDSSASISTTTSSMWEPSPAPAPATYGGTSTMPAPTTMSMTPVPQQYPIPPPLPSNLLPRHNSFEATASQHPMEEEQHHHYTTQSISHEQAAAMGYTVHVNQYTPHPEHGYPPQGGY